MWTCGCAHMYTSRWRPQMQRHQNCAQRSFLRASGQRLTLLLDLLHHRMQRRVNARRARSATPSRTAGAHLSPALRPMAARRCVAHMSQHTEPLYMPGKCVGKCGACTIPTAADTLPDRNISVCMEAARRRDVSHLARHAPRLATPMPRALACLCRCHCPGLPSMLGPASLHNEAPFTKGSRLGGMGIALHELTLCARKRLQPRQSPVPWLDSTP